MTDALPWQYKNEVLASWYTVIKAYQRDNVFLGDSGRLLIQSTTYEMYSTFLCCWWVPDLIRDCFGADLHQKRAICRARSS